MSAPARQRQWVAALAVIALLALLLAGYFAWLASRASPAGLPALPLPAKEPEITLTPAEAADAEAQLQGMMVAILTGGFEIERITKDGQGYVIHCKTKDSVMECRVRKAGDGQPSR